MTDRERFKAICRGEQPAGGAPLDYVPILGFPGSPGMANGCMSHTRERLVEQGMPEWVGAEYVPYQSGPLRSWQRYWGTTSPVYPDFGLALPGTGIACQVQQENGWETYEWETGARTRQVVDNDNIYIMPDFQAFHVRDRKSWEFYRERAAAAGRRPSADIEADIAAFDRGDRSQAAHRSLAIGVGSTWGGLRGLMGPERACTVLYDDPGPAHEIIDAGLQDFETYVAPLIERLRPEILSASEDNCYNHGMLISPRHFMEFCAPFYRRVAEVARDCGVDMVAIDTDGNAMGLVPLVEACGVNAIHPFEVKAGNDLLRLRARHRNFILMGWLEKEVVNEGNGNLIEGEIMSKVPRLLAHGRYFPNGDHGIQPLVTFDNLCRFMTLLHEVTGNPEGEFPRMGA